MVSGEQPTALKAFFFHGVDLTWREGDTQARARCPFCGQHGKLYISIEKGLWDCKKCSIGGNPVDFLRKLHQDSLEQTNDYEELLESRKLLSAVTLKKWLVCRSIISGDWLVPGYGPDGKMNQLYRYVSTTDGYKLYATPNYTGKEELRHQLFGINLYDQSKEHVFLMEGPWDAMALWEVLGRCTKTDSKSKEFTSLKCVKDVKSSLLTVSNVIAVAGCSIFTEKWSELFKGKKVVVLYDNDHPKKNPQTGKMISPPGYAGMCKVYDILTKTRNTPESIRVMNWGEKGYNLELPSGCDIRDLLTKGSRETTIQDRVKGLESVFTTVSEMPESWLSKKKSDSVSTESTTGVVTSYTPVTGIDAEPRYTDGMKRCDGWDVLVNTWRKALKWIEGLDRALSVMLASVVSTELLGDQLWVKVISPAATGKTTLCEAISGNKRFVVAKSTIKGFHSGYQADKTGKEDNSLISQCKNKTLILKDGDTLLKSPNLDQILSEARDIYDRNSRTSYRNKSSRDYEGLSMTWILCGTGALRVLDKSELGVRFIDCVIMDKIDDDLEDEILLRVAHKAEKIMTIRPGNKIEDQYDESMLEAIRTTAGYVEYLRCNAINLVQQVIVPPEYLKMCVHLGKFTAYMRARPSTTQDETAEREFAARLVSQFVRLAKCLAVVLNKKSVDKEVVRRVRRTALDTSRGKTMHILKKIYQYQEEGVIKKALVQMLDDQENNLLRHLNFLVKIGVLNKDSSGGTIDATAQTRYRISRRLYRLYRDITYGEMSKF